MERRDRQRDRAPAQWITQYPEGVGEGLNCADGLGCPERSNLLTRTTFAYKVDTKLCNLRARLKEGSEVEWGKSQGHPIIEPRRSYYCQLLPGMQKDTDSEEVDRQLFVLK